MTIPSKRNQVLEFTQDTLMGVQDLAATDFAFAAICGEQRSVVTWGSPHYGGDSSEVQDQLKEVREIKSNKGSFVAILADGSVVSWGHEGHGADSSQVRDQLQQVEKIASSSSAFCALLRDGSVVTWGRGSEADTRLVSGQLAVGVLDVCASTQAFAAITKEGKVVTWGRPESGGDCRRVQQQIRYL